MMKHIKKIFTTIFVFLIVMSCDDDRDLGFLDTIAVPSDVSAIFEPTQDNSGLVTITPNAEGASYYEITFGDNSETVIINTGESVDHIYAEGSYNVTIKAFNIKDEFTEITLPLVVSFKAPTNLVVTIENDAAVSKQVNITVTADFAISYEFYSGESGSTTPVASGNIGETISYTYTDPGTYPIRIVVKGTAIETTEYTQDFEVTEILAPITSAPTPPFRNDSDVISIYGSSYTNISGTDTFPDWGQAGQGSSWGTFTLDGDDMLQYTNLSYQGIQLGSDQDVSTMESLHLDVWTANVNAIEVSLINNTAGGATEAPVSVNLTQGDWTSIEIPISNYTDQGLAVNQIFQLKFVGDPWAAGTVFIDNIYFWKSPPMASGIEGIWQLAPEAGALKVGPAPNDGSWWTSDAQTVTDRACYFDDKYVLELGGTFKNDLGTETWLEGWQGVPSDQCGAPVAPHDGSTSATYDYNSSTGKLTLTGTGAYLGLPKAVNAGELPNVAVPTTVTYDIVLSNSNNTMEVVIEAGTGVFWTYKLIRYTSPIVGTWKLAPEAGALKVGPAPNDGAWWTSDAQTVIDRGCYFDDEYVFDSNGAFQNVLGTETWLEGWQGVPSDQCGSPVSPHDGSSSASYNYDENTGQLTLMGTGAYLGLPKAVNAGELPNVAVPTSTTYSITLANNDTEMTVVIEAGAGVFWTYKLIK